jgi:hypothetical protein
MPDGYIDRNTRDPDFWANRYDGAGERERKASVGRTEDLKA